MKYYIGVDISQSFLDVHWAGKAIRFTNNKVGFKEFVNFLLPLSRANELALITCEASGGYEQAMVRYLQQRTLPVHVAHPNKVKAFAKAIGLKAKTDKMDAQLIAQYSQVMGCTKDEEKPPHITQLSKFVHRREQLVKQRACEKTLLKKCEDKWLARNLNSHIQYQTKLIAQVDRRIQQLINHDRLQPLFQIISSIPGIGTLNAAYVMALLPELGQISHRALAALVGVAPFNKDSGQHKGSRHIKGGRKLIRNKLYMSAVVSIRCDPESKAFYQRLKQQGKPTKVALIAVVRKLVILLNSLVKRQVCWQPCNNYKKA